MELIERRFGTFRGAVRLALSYGEIAIGQAGIVAPAPENVSRLVFVCHGNICRSAAAEAAARAEGLSAASFGLSTGNGKPAHPPAVQAAAALGLSLADHRATRAEDFEAQPGDLLVAMETRHLRTLSADPELARLPRVLLGSYLSPPLPHLHDPYELADAYMPVCLARVIRAVSALGAAFPGARRALPSP